MNRLHGVNIERFAKLLAKRWKRNPLLSASGLPELKALTWYSEGLSSADQIEVCHEIKRVALEIRGEN